MPLIINSNGKVQNIDLSLKLFLDICNAQKVSLYNEALNSINNTKISLDQEIALDELAKRYGNEG